MSNIATTIEQSKQLVRLGLDPKTADMFYFSYGMFRPMKLHVGKILEDVVTGKRQWAIPAWSLSALLEVTPKELEVGLFKTPISGEYFFSWWTDDHHMGYDYKEPIDATFEMVCWLLKQGLIKKGDNDDSNVHNN